MDCKVSVPDFEGPLDLLLHLIKTHELDIVNLPISQITRQYLTYLDYMREMNLDLATEYLVMAATLTFLKSQVILPQEEVQEATGADPRAQLIRRLIELKNYKELAAELTARPRLFRDVFLARNTGAEEIESTLEAEVALTNPFQLVEAYRLLLDRRKVVEHRVYNDEVPIGHCIDAIIRRFDTEESFTFESLLPNPHRPRDLISMFLGTLESAKMGMVRFEQSEVFGPIQLHKEMNADDMRIRRRNYNSEWETHGNG